MSGWSAEQRATVARLLAESIDPSPATMRSPVRRNLVLTVGGVGVVVLLPWLVFLSATLPATSDGGAWRIAWVGFDIALVAAFAATVIARLRGQDETAVPLWRQPMIHFTPPAFDGEDESAGRTR